VVTSSTSNIDWTTIPHKTLAPPVEVCRIYGDLLQTCADFKDGTSPESFQILKTNVEVGHSLFQQMESTSSMDGNQLNGTPSTSFGNTASESLMAIHHTQACASMLNKKVKNLGKKPDSFNLDEFLAVLVEMNNKCLIQVET